MLRNIYSNCIKRFINEGLLTDVLTRYDSCKQTILKAVFETPLQRVKGLTESSLEAQKFSDKEVMKACDDLMEIFNTYSGCLIHANFSAENILLKSCRNTMYAVVSRRPYHTLLKLKHSMKHHRLTVI